MVNKLYTYKYKGYIFTLKPNNGYARVTQGKATKKPLNNTIYLGVNINRAVFKTGCHTWYSNNIKGA